MKRTVVLLFLGTAVWAGPYNEPGVSGWVDAGFHPAPPPGTPGYLRHPDPNSIRIHPVYRGWVTAWSDYQPSDTEWYPSFGWDDPSDVIGPATGNHFDIVSLGDLDDQELAAGKSPGRITLCFGDPNNPNDEARIRNGRGYDFAVFENGFLSDYSTPGGSIAGRMLAELAFVEVSTDGILFARFPSVSLTDGPIGPYGTIDITNLYNLAGKHPNAGGRCVGTPFDLDDLTTHPLVQDGLVDLNHIRFVRLVDIPGNGSFSDAATCQMDPLSYDPNQDPHYRPYVADHAVYDAWLTVGSGGFDLEAVGVLNEQQYSADIDLNGQVDMEDLASLASSWNTRFGQAGYILRCDLSRPRDWVVNLDDVWLFAEQWLSIEEWRISAVRSGDKS